MSGTVRCQSSGKGKRRERENMGDRPNRDISWFLSSAFGVDPRDERLVDDGMDDDPATENKSGI